MDKRKLIAEVFLRAPIWDKTNKNHHNSVVLTKLWKEVARECNQPSMAVVKGQWKRLRESFMKKLKENSEDGEEPSWPYFQCLLFLKDQCVLKQAPGSSTDWDTVSYGFDDSNQRMDESECKREFLDDTIEPDSISHLLSPLNSTSSPTLSPVIPSVAKSNITRVTESMDRTVDLFGAEQEKIEYSKRREEKKQEVFEIDEDASFFNSILPHVRTLNARKKIKFRIQILQFLDNEMSEGNNPDEFLNT